MMVTNKLPWHHFVSVSVVAATVASGLSPLVLEQRQGPSGGYHRI